MLLMRTAARIELLQERAGAFRISLGTTNKKEPRYSRGSFHHKRWRRSSDRFEAHLHTLLWVGVDPGFLRFGHFTPRG
jgi:hypothetical protein